MIFFSTVELARLSKGTIFLVGERAKRVSPTLIMWFEIFVYIYVHRDFSAYYTWSQCTEIIFRILHVGPDLRTLLTRYCQDYNSFHLFFCATRFFRISGVDVENIWWGYIFVVVQPDRKEQGKALSSISIECLHAIHHLGQIFIVYPMEEEIIKEEREDNKALQSRREGVWMEGGDSGDRGETKDMGPGT